MPPGVWPPFLVFVLAAAQSAVGLIAHGRSAPDESVFSTPEADVTHLVMNAVMAAMLTPLFTAAAGFGARLLLAFTALGVALALVRHRPGARRAGPLSFRAYAVAAAYHVLMLGAMIYALWIMAPVAGAMCWPAPGAMAGMGHAPHRGSGVARLLGVVFALDALTGAVAVVALPRQLLAAEAPSTGLTQSSFAVSSDRRQVRRLRVGFIPHLVMDAGMVWMLFTV